MLTPREPHPDAAARSTPASEPPAADARVARLRAEVAARLAPVCAGMPPEPFARLVEDVAQFTLRWSPDGARDRRAD